MIIIDADTHVIEGDRTWAYLARSERHLVQKISVEDVDGTQHPGWLIDGRPRLANGAAVDETSMTRDIRELADIDGRLRQMDEFGIDFQVIYPTVFLNPVTRDPTVEVALCRSYNRYLAAQTALSGGRMSWAVVPPLMTIQAAIREIRVGAQHGAKAVFWRGFESGKLPDDPYFAPVLREIDQLGLALCIHAGNGTEMLTTLNSRISARNSIWPQKLPGVTAFHAMMGSGLAAQYPNIRFGFVELAAGWVPYVLQDVVLRMLSPDGWSPQRQKDQWKTTNIASLMREHRFFVACLTNDDLPYILQYAGAGNIIAGSDFGHADTASELRALQRIHETPGVDPQSLDNILDANPRKLYNL